MSHFWRISFQLVFYWILLTGCSSTKSLRSRKVLPSVTYFPTTLKNARLAEQDIGSKDISRKYTVGIDTSLYPNKSHFRLTKVKRYLRPSRDEGMDYTIEYFATSDDSVRTILHEWNVAEKSGLPVNDSILADSDLPQVTIINAFQSKFSKLDSTLTSSLGRPVIKNINSNFLEETERDDIKWIGQRQLNAYLLMFKRDGNTYRQIRVIVYPR